MRCCTSGGAHQLYNHTDQPFKYLDLGTFQGLDVVEYPDSGKINILPNQELYETGSRVDYFKGEENVRKHWDECACNGG